MVTAIGKYDAPTLLIRSGDNVYAEESVNDQILNNPSRECPADKGEPFVQREGIASSAGVLLKPKFPWQNRRRVK